MAKLCPSCGQHLPRSAFYTSCSAKDGLQSKCKSCDNRARRARMRGETGSRKDFVDLAVSRSRRLASRARRATGEYRGVTGGPLLAGYVR